jgi:hypothetical protein
MHQRVDAATPTARENNIGTIIGSAGIDCAAAAFIIRTFVDQHAIDPAAVDR